MIQGNGKLPPGFMAIPGVKPRPDDFTGCQGHGRARLMITGQLHHGTRHRLDIAIGYKDTRHTVFKKLGRPAAVTGNQRYAEIQRFKARDRERFGFREIEGDIPRLQYNLHIIGVPVEVAL